MERVKKIAKYLRYFALKMSTQAGSGHPTSSLSAADLMTVLLANYFRYDFKNPDSIFNDRLVFSKGHATPLYYAMFAAMGAISPKELDSYRKFGSSLEGHPTPNFKYAEAATGSLGQGLSVGVGLALAIRSLTGHVTAAEVGHDFFMHLPNSSRSAGLEAVGVLKKHDLPAVATSLSHHPSINYPFVYVLIGDGEMAEGNVWEAANIASYYRLDNLVAILDVNRLGQSQETSIGWDVHKYTDRFHSFGWETVEIDGHDCKEINVAMKQCNNITMKGKPFAIIAKTIKGKGISFLENKDGWHGKPVPPDQLKEALLELGVVDLNLRVKISIPPRRKISYAQPSTHNPQPITYKLGDQIATRKAYGEALSRIGVQYQNVVSLDGDVKNSTYSEIFKAKFPERFFEMFIAEQNMVGTAVGMARLGLIPFVSTFAAFLTRAFDQIRMASVGNANIKFCGSHAGVSIGEDGPSQMGLEDIAMFRSVLGCSVLYPADAVATDKLVEEMAKVKGMSYLRTTRPATPVIYGNDEEFSIGGCKIHRTNNKKQITNNKNKILIIAAGITLYEALKAQEELVKEGIEAIVVDCYSVKPIDEKTLKELVAHTFKGVTFKGAMITVEDHYFEGGLGDAVLNVFAHDDKVEIYKMAVTKKPRSGTSAELLDFEGISANAIVQKVKSVI